MKQIPLHYQIFVALVIGTAIGLLANPGEVPIDDEKLELSTSAVRLADGSKIVLRYEDPEGLETYEKTLPNLDALAKRSPELADQLRKAEKDRPKGDKTALATKQVATTVNVTNRRVHIAQDDKHIVLTYTRLHDGRPISSKIEGEDAAALGAANPRWQKIYDEHGGGWRAVVASVSKFVGDIFLRMLKMITIPLIVTSLVTGVAGLGDTSRFGAMFGKTLLYYFCTSVLAIATGIGMVNLVRPGLGADLPGGGEAILHGDQQTLTDIFVGLVNNMIPPNPIQSLAGAEFLSIITFSILIGIFIIHTGGRSAQTMRDFFQAGFDIMMRMTMAIISLAPIGVFAFMVYATASQGLEIFKTLAWYMLTVALALLVHAVIVLPLIVYVIGRRSPWKFAQAMSPALMTAFSTASSNGTLPLTISSVEQRAKVPNRVSSFVLPLGATINMDGTALYEAVAVLFISQAYTGVVMPVPQQVIVAITALLASVGAAGIPHAGLVMMAIVLQAVGLPLEAQGVIIAVDRVLDMCRTSVNVWSDSCGCAVLARFETGGTTGVSAEPVPEPAG